MRRLQSKADEVRKAYGQQVADAEDHWEGNQLHFGFTTMGMKIKGQMTVEPAAVAVAADIPMMAMMFKGPIERRVQEELGKVLA